VEAWTVKRVDHEGGIMSNASTPRLSPEERGLVRARVLDFVRQQVVPQAEGEEAVHGLSNGHGRIKRTAKKLAGVDVNDGVRVEALLYELHAAIARHFAEAELMLNSAWDDDAA
jgi:hypothetical protein